MTRFVNMEKMGSEACSYDRVSRDFRGKPLEYLGRPSSEIAPAHYSPVDMDPSMFLQYSPPNGLPQESKLVTYMNRNATTPMRPLSHAMGKLSLDSSPTANKKILMSEFVPTGYYASTPVLPDSPEASPPTNLSASSSNTQVHQVGGTTYFYATNDNRNQSGVLNSSPNLGVVPVNVPTASAYPQMYAGTPTHVNPLSTKAGLATTFYSPETIHSEINQRIDPIYMQPDIHQYPDIPNSVETYGELMPLEASSPHGALATSYRVTNRLDGQHRAMRRLHSYSTTNATRQLDLWKHLDHTNVVRLHEFFTTKTFNDHSMVFVYDYHPGSETLQVKYMSNTGNDRQSGSSNGAAFMDPFSSDPDAPRPYSHQKNALLRAVACGTLLPESLMWSILVQLTAGLRAIHNAGLACRNLNPSKVIMTGCRVRFAWCGTADALTPNSGSSSASADIAQAQQEDLTALGRVALSLACRSVHAPSRDNFQASIELVSRTYSSDLKNLIMYLMSTTTPRRTVTDLMPIIGARFYNQPVDLQSVDLSVDVTVLLPKKVEALQKRADYTEQQLAREVDNGRLFRLLTKLGTINERPELNMDSSWSETGDRYMLKLFRDYLFHTVTPDGRPWLDTAHVVYNLNQLDAGTDNRVQLMSRDEQSVLVVTYAELKHCLDQAFGEVLSASEPTPIS